LSHPEFESGIPLLTHSLNTQRSSDSVLGNVLVIYWVQTRSPPSLFWKRYRSR